MPYQSIPYSSPTIYEPRYTQTIAELMARRGDIQAAGALRQGAIVSNTIGRLGEVAAEGIGQYQEKKYNEQKERAAAEVLQTWDGKDPQQLYLGLTSAIGPDRANKIMAGIGGLFKMSQEKRAASRQEFIDQTKALAALPKETLAQTWPSVGPLWRQGAQQHIGLQAETVPEQFDETVPQIMGGLSTAFGAKAEGGFNLSPGQTRFDPTGKPVASLPPTPTKPKEYQVTVPGSNGPVTRLATEEEMRAGVREYQKPAASLRILAGKEEDEKINAADIVEGRADLSLYSKKDNRSLMAEASRYSMQKYGKPFSFNKAMLDFTAAKRHVLAMNSNQRYTFRGLADTVVNTMDEVKMLAEELKQGDIQKFNRARRSTILELYGNTKQSALAAKYISAVNTLKEEFANLAQGGFAPTEAAWKLAEEQINTDYGVKDFIASVNEAQRLINYRVQAFENLGPAYVGGEPGQAGGGGFKLPQGGGAGPASRPPGVPANYRFDEALGVWRAP